MNKVWKIYVHKNKINGKIYIGLTSEKNVKRRWHGGANYTDCVYFYNAIKKYGWDGFEHFILFDNIPSLEQANLIEEYLISKFHSNERDFGYNLQSGGGSRLQSEESKKKISEIKIKQHQEKEEVKRVKEQFQSIEDKLENLKDNNVSLKGVKRPQHKYICIETQKVYNSFGEAERDTGISARAIRGVCQGIQKSTKNTHWDYYKEGKEYLLENYLDSKSKNTKPQKIYCKELDIVFNSGSEAARYLELPNAGHIFECCKGIRTHCRGYYWEFFEKEA